MQNRLKTLRTALNLTQADFAARLKLSRSIIATYESDRAAISDRTINDICREFNVREAWLRTGEGVMFNIPKSINTELAAEMGKLLRSDDDDFTKQLFLRYLKLPPEFKVQFRKFLTEVLNACDEKSQK